MSEVAPPSAVPPPAPQAVPVRITVTTAPPAVAELPAGTKLDVIVTELLDATQIKLSSRLGEITLKAPQPLPLKTGDALIVQLLSSGGNPRVQLASADGRLLPLLAKAQTATPQPGTAPLAGTNAAPVNVVPGAIVTASLLRPVSVNAALIVQARAGAAIPPSTGQGTQPGPGLSGPKPGPGAVTSPTAPATSPVTGKGPGGTAIGTDGKPATVTQTGSTGQPNATQNVIAAASRLEVRIVSVNVPASAPARLMPPASGSAVSLAPGAALTGIVSGRQGIGQTVVQTHAGPLSLPTQQALPPGTEIRFEIVSLKPPAAGTPLHGTQHAGSVPLLDGSWPTFDEALDVLREVAPGAHQHIMQAALPRADTQLATNILFFLSALRGGDIKNWLGDGPVRILEKLRPDLAGRLKTDMGQMTRRVEDPLSGDWRLQGVPFLFGAEIDRIQLLIRDQEDGETGDEETRGGTRFVVDLQLSRLGHLQIDGLVGEKNKRLDLVLRTDAPLPQNFREDIRLIYNDALELTGLEGSVGFQAQPGNFVNIPKKVPGTEAGGVVA